MKSNVMPSIVKIEATRKDLDQKTTHRYQLSSMWNFDSADAKLVDGVLTLKFSKRVQENTKKILLK